MAKFYGEIWKIIPYQFHGRSGILWDPTGSSLFAGIFTVKNKHLLMTYHKIPKILDTLQFAVIALNS